MNTFNGMLKLIPSTSVQKKKRSQDGYVYIWMNALGL